MYQARISFVALLFVSAVFSAGAAEIKHRILLSDEGNNNIVLLDQNDTTKNWKFSVGQTSRSLQLIGNNTLLVGTAAGGYHEINLTTGKESKRGTFSGGSTSAIRLPSGNTILAWETDGSRMVAEVKPDGSTARQVAFTGVSTLRLTTCSAAGSILFGSDKRVVEGNWQGQIVWDYTVPDSVSPSHVWKALRMADGTTWASIGYGAALVCITADKKIKRVIKGGLLPNKTEVNPKFFAGFQVLKNGNIVVANWQNHGSGHGGEGIQLLEFDTTGALVWSYKNPALYSSVHNILVLDDLNTAVLHDENSGRVAPATTTGILLRSSAGVDNKSLTIKAILTLGTQDRIVPAVLLTGRQSNSFFKSKPAFSLRMAME